MRSSHCEAVSYTHLDVYKRQECDDLPEQAFRYAGTIDDVRERAAKMGA